MSRNLLIVESPSKAKTLKKYLGRNFEVLASYGHVRDLEAKEGAVDPDNDFNMRYAMVERNRKHVDAIARAAEDADQVLLATDPDREGEAIAWHLAAILAEGNTKARIRRIEFNEITKDAIQNSLKKPRDIDTDRVNAQQARRVLDRLVGYKISPLLWDKVRRGLSAGRVQSVALKLVCDREAEIDRFVSEEYWNIGARLAAAQPPEFDAKLLKRDGANIKISNKEEADAALADLRRHPRRGPGSPRGAMSSSPSLATVVSAQLSAILATSSAKLSSFLSRPSPRS